MPTTAYCRCYGKNVKYKQVKDGVCRGCVARLNKPNDQAIDLTDWLFKGGKPKPYKAKGNKTA